MWQLDRAEGLVIITVIASLLVLGTVLTLRSGVVNVSTGQGMRQMASNLYQTLLVLALCLVSLVVIQHYAGLGSMRLW